MGGSNQQLTNAFLTGATLGMWDVGKKVKEEVIDRPKHEMEWMAEKQKKEADKLIADKNEKDRVSDLATQRDQQRARQKTTSSSVGGRSGTILTSPLGTTTTPTSGGKTLLGM